MLRDEMKSYFFETLCKGEYNLLLGAGVSLDSVNIKNEKMLSGEMLRRQIASILNAKDNTPLNRLSRVLIEDKRNDVLDEIFTNGYTTKTTGNSLKYIPNYVWKNIFTFNIDNVLETVYHNYSNCKQNIVPINYIDSLSVDRDLSNLQLIHLHGTVDAADKGYVFSINDYVNFMREINPWMVMLAEALPVDPFIISGASLSEPDLEFYLSKKLPNSPRKSNAPSLLIEPFPDSVIESECKTRGITIVKATMEDFMNWVFTEMSKPPTIQELFNFEKELFHTNQVSEHESLKFSTDFRTIYFRKLAQNSKPSSFFYGSEPTENDINQHLDIERKNCFAIYSKILNDIQNKKKSVQLIVDEPFSGKTTFLFRILEKLNTNGIHILKVVNNNRIDTVNSINCLAKIGTPVIIWFDYIADRMTEVNDILAANLSNVFIVGSTRNYRYKQISSTSIADIVVHKPSIFSDDEYLRLIENYRTRGLVGESKLLSWKGVDLIKNDVVGIAICRIMNDFRPLQSIITTLISDTTAENSKLYLYVALSQYCYAFGIDYKILQSIMGIPINQFVNAEVPLKTVTNQYNSNYVICQNDVIAQSVLDIYKSTNNTLLFDIMVTLARAIAPFVNRKTIKIQTPEARLSKRLLNFNDVVSNFINSDSERFYLTVQTEWEWNSRYWEQRALAILQTDVDLALRYAKQAIAIEEHPYTLNTYATVLCEHMKCYPSDAEYYFDLILTNLETAISLEKRHSRLSVYPLMTLVTSTLNYCRNYHNLTRKQKDTIKGLISFVTGSIIIDQELSQKVREVEMYT